LRVFDTIKMPWYLTMAFFKPNIRRILNASS
jgi:hypothetical protein